MKWTTARKAERLNAIRDNFDNGYLRFYSGTKPADANTSLAGNTLLGELRFAATAFPSTSTDTLTANALTADSDADATGTASFARCFESDGTTVIGDLTVGTSGADIIMPTLAIAQHIQISISSLTISEPAGS
jgi:hypothetical protein